MLGICLTCGHLDDIEQHHVAGRRHYPALTVPVCVACHSVLSSWQRGHGLDLRGDAAVDVDRTRALAVGLLDLLRLAAQRHPDRVLVGGSLATLTGRAFSRLLDLTAPADRPGRWLPDPTQPPVEAVPVAWVPDTAADLTVLQARLAADLLDLTGDLPQMPTAVLRHIAAHPHHFDHAWQDLMTDPRTATELLTVIDTHLAHSRRLVRSLLTVGHPDGLDEVQLEEIRIWFDTGRRLLDQLVTLAGYPVEAA